MRARSVAASMAAAAALSGGAVAAVPGSAGAAPSLQAVAHRNVVACPSPPTGYAHCHAIVREAVTSDGHVVPNTAPSGISPSAYLQDYGWANATGTLIGNGSGQTIAIVDAYDDPTIASDLSYFDSTYGLPTASFKKVNQSGTTSYPQPNSGWSLEISLDVEWAHAIAPAASILLVEASSASFTNLLAAEDYAANHAAYVTNSWGGNEFSGESTYDSHFVHSGVSFFASAGDTGGVVEYPSASPDVISVGGTTLTASSETGWSSSGGGCSAYESANSYQNDAPVGCAGRATPDVASDADPNSGVSVYDTTSYNGRTGWFVVGGTSAASPVWAARSADRNAVVNAQYVYAGYTATASSWGTNIAFRDITSGNNGYPAGVGYDLVTGIGSWTGGDSTSSSGGGGTTGSPLAISSQSCSGATCTFSATGGTSPYTWTFGDGGSGTGASVSHAYKGAGSYTVTLTDSTGASATTSVSCATSGSRRHPTVSCTAA